MRAMAAKLTMVAAVDLCELLRVEGAATAPFSDGAHQMSLVRRDGPRCTCPPIENTAPSLIENQTRRIGGAPPSAQARPTRGG